MLKDDVQALFGEVIEKPNPYEKYSLLKNPFPGHGERPRADVCTDQEKIKEKFAEVLRNFGTETKRLRIEGANGAGKTNILRYFESLTERIRLEGRIDAIYPIYIHEPGDNYFVIHQQIIERLAEFFLDDLLNGLRGNLGQVKVVSKEMKPAKEILSVIECIVKPDRTLFSDLYEADRKDIFVDWLMGHKLSVQQKKSIGGDKVPEISSASLAIRFLNSLLQLLKEMELCNGIVLLFDEFEEIFSQSLTRARQARYVQDLRHLFDVLQEPTFLVIATTPEPRDLSKYPAITRRIGEALPLQPIDSEDLAIAYVKNYLRAGRMDYFTEKEDLEKLTYQSLLEQLEPLTEQTIIQVYQSVKEEADKQKFEVLPDRFLPRMKQRFQEIIENKHENKP
jgi:hypothetical protein